MQIRHAIFRPCLRSRSRCSLITTFLCVSLSLPAVADIQWLGNRSEDPRSDLFSDGMVLQRNKVRIWGDADSAGGGELITVQFCDRSCNTACLASHQDPCTAVELNGCNEMSWGPFNAEANGSWRLLPDLELDAGGPYTLNVCGGSPSLCVSGSNDGNPCGDTADCPDEGTCPERPSQETVAEVMIGEVWMCAGQSNMTLACPNCVMTFRDYPPEILNQSSEIRLFAIDRQSNTKERWSWVEDSAWSGPAPPATCFWFAKHLSKRLTPSGSPTPITVGIVNAAIGGSPIKPWFAPVPPTDPEYGYLSADPTYADVIANGGQWYRAMIKPLEQMSFKGVAWWQGEKNQKRPAAYAHYLPAMIRSWRAAWPTGDSMPFIFVQLVSGGGLVLDNSQRSRSTLKGQPAINPERTRFFQAMRQAYVKTLLSVSDPAWSLPLTFRLAFTRERNPPSERASRRLPWPPFMEHLRQLYLQIFLETIRVRHTTASYR